MQLHLDLRLMLPVVRAYTWNVLIALDQLLNTLAGGDPDEVVSSVLGKAELGMYGRFWKYALRPLRLAVDGVFRLTGERNHCHNSIEWDEGPRSLYRRLFIGR